MTDRQSLSLALISTDALDEKSVDSAKNPHFEEIGTMTPATDPLAKALVARAGIVSPFAKAILARAEVILADAKAVVANAEAILESANVILASAGAVIARAEASALVLKPL